MKKLFLALFFIATSALALPPSAEQVRDELGAKNAIEISTRSLAQGKIKDLTCPSSEIAAADSCKSGGAYIVKGSDWTTKVYIYTCSDLVDCGEL